MWHKRPLIKIGPSRWLSFPHPHKRVAGRRWIMDDGSVVAWSHGRSMGPWGHGAMGNRVTRGVLVQISVPYSMLLEITIIPILSGHAWRYRVVPGGLGVLLPSLEALWTRQVLAPDPLRFSGKLDHRGKRVDLCKMGFMAFLPSPPNSRLVAQFPAVLGEDSPAKQRESGDEMRFFRRVFPSASILGERSWNLAWQEQENKRNRLPAAFRMC